MRLKNVLCSQVTPLGNALFMCHLMSSSSRISNCSSTPLLLPQIFYAFERPECRRRPSAPLSLQISKPENPKKKFEIDPASANEQATAVVSQMDMEIEGEQAVVKDEDLFKAAENGDFSIFEALSHQQLLKSLSLRNEDRRSLLHVAASSSRSAVVKILSAADPSVSGINSPDEEGWVPLHSAASIGNVEIVEILLSRGADVNLKNDGGRTALHYAASKGWLKIAEILLSHGAKIDLKDKVGCSPLHRAASTGNSELCELLIEEGAEIDATDRAGQTPLMNAVICENKEVALLLIRHGADVDVEDKEGYTVLGRASKDLRPVLIDAAKAMLED